MFTLFVIPGDNALKPERAIDSFGSLVTRSFVLPHREIPFHKVRTEFYGFLYADEYIEARLRDSLAYYFLHSNRWQALSLAKMVYDNNIKDWRWAQSPRIFKRGIILTDALVPQHRCMYLKAFDGFIREDARGFA